MKRLLIALLAILNSIIIFNLNDSNIINASALPSAPYYIYGRSTNLRKIEPINHTQITLQNTGQSDNWLSISINNDEDIFTSSFTSHEVRMYRDSGTSLQRIWTYTGFNTFINQVRADMFGNVYAVSSDQTVRKINNNGQLIWSYTGFNNAVQSIDVLDNGNIIVGDQAGNIKHIDFNGNLIWAINNAVNRAEKIIVSKDNLSFYVMSQFNTNDQVKKYNISNQNLLWTFNVASNLTNQDIGLGYNDDFYLVTNDGFNQQLAYKINTSNGSGTLVINRNDSRRFLQVEVDANGFIFIRQEEPGFTGDNNVIAIYEPINYTIFNISPRDTGQRVFALPPEEPEPPFYDVNLTTNYPNFIDLIYVDVSGTSIGASINKIIPNDRAFSITSGVIDITPFTFNFWLDLDTNTIFSTDRTFDIANPNRNYNLEANFSLNQSVFINLDSDLPSPPNFNLIVQTLENNTNSVIQYPFNNFAIPFGYNYEITAPTDQVGFYEFDYWYDNDNNQPFTNSALISLIANENYNLTATYSLPEEYQINLILDSPVGVITFQHGILPPITGSFISVTIGQGDSWTATAPLNENFQFINWIDLDFSLIFSNNRQFTVSNTTRNYFLSTNYVELVTINWNSLGGTPIPSQKIIIGSQINAPTNPIRPNFAFGGWALPSAPNTPIIFPQSVPQSITYQAIWLPTYQLTFNTNGGQPIQSQTIIENNLPTVVTPSRFGYTFEGWFTDNLTFNNPFNFNQPFTSNTTIHAQWSFGTTANAQTSLQSFLGNARLDNPIAQWILVLSLFILLNVMIFIYKGPFIVTIILNFILTALFIVFGFIPIWITIVLFMAIFGFMILMLSGGRS